MEEGVLYLEMSPNTPLRVLILCASSLPPALLDFFVFYLVVHLLLDPEIPTLQYLLAQRAAGDSPRSQINSRQTEARTGRQPNHLRGNKRLQIVVERSIRYDKDDHED
jgi:hypothetical protein